jgi:hypothetical protein
MRFAEADIRRIANDAGVSDKAVFRLLGSLKVRVMNPAQADAEGRPACREMDLGLRLNLAVVLAPLVVQLGKDKVLADLGEVVRSYFSACPQVCGWVARGDFKPDAVPDLITKAMLTHACRTAGRLRAKALRAA